MSGRHHSGFTLIEVLVTLVIVAMLSGLTVLSLTYVGRDSQLPRQIEGLEAWLNTAQLMAIYSNEPIWASVIDDRVRLYWWSSRERAHLSEKRISSGVRDWLGAHYALDQETHQGLLFFPTGRVLSVGRDQYDF